MLICSRSPENLGQHITGQRHLLRGKGGPGRQPQSRCPGRHRRRTEAPDPHATIQACRRRGDGDLGVTEDDRDDGRGGFLGDIADPGQLGRPGQHRTRQLRLRDQHLQRSERRTDGGRGQPGVEDEGARGVDEVGPHGGRAEHRAALTAERLGQRRGHHHIRRAGQPDFVQQTLPARTAHPETVRLIDHQQRAESAAHLVQFAQRGQHPVGAEHRLGDHDGTLLGPGRQRIGDRRDIAVRGHRDAGPRQPARVDDRGMGQRVGHQQRAGTGQRYQRPDIRGVARGEHQGRLESGEIGECGLELLMQFGVTGDQARAPGAGTPGAQRLHAAGQHIGVLGQPEIVVGGQIELGADGRAGPQRAAQPLGAAALLDTGQPGQWGKTGACHWTSFRHLNTVQVNARATATMPAPI
uniref:Uncharacterized protein n=1 Tax=Mycolicibacterium neoaurum VKM Ac-1815D TaxID=700508 RepID=V5XJQ0_MYCNE